MPTNAKTTFSLQPSIDEARTLGERLRLLLSDGRTHLAEGKRGGLCLIHWSILFEHHEGILFLLEQTLYAPALALLRPFEESFLRLFVVINGTENQVTSIWNGTYNTEFEIIGKQIDQKLGLVEPQFEPWFKKKSMICMDLLIVARNNGLGISWMGRAIRH